MSKKINDLDSQSRGVSPVSPVSITIHELGVPETNVVVSCKGDVLVVGDN